MGKGRKTTSGNASRDADGDYGIPPCPLAIHWFCNDLRLHNNVRSGIRDVARIYGSSIRTPLGSLKCGPRRAKFTL
ncbi:hypothetical protein ACHAWF_004122 [Thalassiosira exigua]